MNTFICSWLVATSALLAGADTKPAEGDDLKDAMKLVLQQQDAHLDVVKKVKPSVVAIFARGGQGGGSGVLISKDGYAVTNFHVTKGAGTTMKCGLADGKLYDAVIVGIDPVGDVALIKLIGRDDFPFAEMADSNKVKIGDPAMAMGNPFLLATDFNPTVTLGIVSGTHRYQFPSGGLLEYGDCIQMDASINPGNSGGPLFNMKGEVIGINGRGSFEKRVRINVGVGYAISINQVKNFMYHLKGGLIIDHASLGAMVGSDDKGRVMVQSLIENGDAFRRGLRSDDEIVRFGPRPVSSTNQYLNALCIHPKGWRVPIIYRRDQEKKTIWVRLDGAHRDDELEEKIGAKAAPASGPAAKFFKFEKGYANYYFNKKFQDEILEAQPKFSDSSQPWNLTIGSEAGSEIELKFDKNGVKWGEKRGGFEYVVGRPTMDPPGTGGLLVTLNQWYSLWTSQREFFSDFHFAGGYPDRDGKMMLAIESYRGGIRTLFYFDEESKQLKRMECFVEKVSRTAEGDPCEVVFKDFKKVDGKLFPHSWEIHTGGEKITTYTVKKAELGK